MKRGAFRHCRQAKRKLAPVLVPRLCLGTFSEVALPPTNLTGGRAAKNTFPGRAWERAPERVCLSLTAMSFSPHAGKHNLADCQSPSKNKPIIHLMNAIRLYLVSEYPFLNHPHHQFLTVIHFDRAHSQLLCHQSFEVDS